MRDVKDMTRETELLREACGLFGPSGCEGEVADWIESRVRPLCDSLCRDRMGNLLCLIRGGDPAAAERKRVMISAHMDEVGVMITEIREDGTLLFDTVGSILVPVLEGRRVVLGDERHRVNGVIASKAIHHIPAADRERMTPRDKLYIDIGVSSREEAEALVSVGSFGVFDSEFYRFGKDGGTVKGKALDDRMGCVAMIEIMEALRRKPVEGDLDLYFCFTTREEIGGLGARVAAQKLAPHFSLVLETTAIGDLPGVEPRRQVAHMGKGGALSFMDRATVYDRPLLELALAAAKEEEIPVQIKQFVSGGNDSGVIHKSGTGVRPMALSVPTRYLHSASCVASLADYAAVRALCEAVLRRLGKNAL